MKGKSSDWAFGTTREAYEKAGNLDKKHGFLKANHCASRRKGRSYLVAHLPALQQFSSSGQYLEGIDGEEVLQLVVCNLWRKV